MNTNQLCTNCGCTNPQKTYDGYWCKMCKNEMSDTKHTTDMNDFWIELDGPDVREVVCDLLLDEATQGADYCNEVASRIVACVNACFGMSDPAKEITSLRARLAELEQPEPEPTTVIGWLQRLPDGYRERALSQCKMLSLNCDTMATSVHFMSKHQTVEGWPFWDDVYLHYKRGTHLPPLPI